ncbi:MAG: hypothetical protein F6K17_05845, partial [Okeania sp. SIO3C4]|nr:hypothetical protein [Okeania sp. SIO3C4]
IAYRPPAWMVLPSRCYERFSRLLPGIAGLDVSGQYTVLLDPYMAGVFIHEAFGHLSEADSIYENPQMEELLKLGKPIGTKKLNVIDDATIDGLSGSIKYDDEGVPGKRKYLQDLRKFTLKTPSVGVNGIRPPYI